MYASSILQTEEALTVEGYKHTHTHTHTHTRKLQNILPQGSLLTIFKSFVRPHLDYDNVIYDQSYNNAFHQKMESVQYNVALAITGAIRGSSREKLYQELGLESLQQQRLYRKLCYFFKLTKNKSPKYLFNNTPAIRSAY